MTVLDHLQKKRGEPAWEIAHLFPVQGKWTVEEYARAGIAEYWIVDPQQKLVTVLVLQDEVYRLHAEFKPGMQLNSVLLAGFSLSVSDIFAAALPPYQP